MKKYQNKRWGHPSRSYVQVTQVQDLLLYVIEEFEIYFKYCKALKFEERPDYVWIRRLFKDLFYKCDY